MPHMWDNHTLVYFWEDYLESVRTSNMIVIYGVYLHNITANCRSLHPNEGAMTALEAKYIISLLALSVGCILASKLIALVIATRRPRNFPPGPPTIPVLGNLHLLPTTKGFIKQVHHTQHRGLVRLT